MTKPIMQFMLCLQGISLIVIAPLLMGWIKRIKCWMQLRKSPALCQPYSQLLKLFIKQPALAENASWIFRFAPFGYFTIYAFVCFAVPFFMINTLASHAIDVIIFIGLMTLARLLLALSAMDVGTAFGNLGARRELFISCLSEPILLIVLFNIVLLTHSAYFSVSANYFLSHVFLFPSLIFSFLAFILVIFAETGRIPIDNPATHLELTMVHEAMILEYSGRYLALIEWGNAIRFGIYTILISTLFFPLGITAHFGLGNLLLSLVIALVKLFTLVGIIGFIESINSKLRFFKIADYLTTAFALSVLGVLVTQLLESIT